MPINIAFLITAIFLLVDSILALLSLCSDLWGKHKMQEILDSLLLISAGLTSLSLSIGLIVLIVCVLY